MLLGQRAHVALRLSRPGLAPSWRCGPPVPLGARYVARGRLSLEAVAAVQPVRPARPEGTGANSAAVPFGGTTGGSLAELHDQAGLMPKPELFDERLKPGFRGGRALFVFFLCNALPFGALLYYLREQRSRKAELSLTALPASGEAVAAEALRTIRTSAGCFLLHGDKAQGSALHVDPHSPEGTAYLPPTEPLPLVPQMERNDITDIFESPATPGLGFVHLALSRASAAGAQVLAGDRQASLLYVSGTRGSYCTVAGQLSVLSDPESRRRYWKNQWAASFFGTPVDGPDAVPSPWLHPDYLLLRLAITDVSVRAMVDGPQRWSDARAQKFDNGWGVVAPASQAAAS